MKKFASILTILAASCISCALVGAQVHVHPKKTSTKTKPLTTQATEALTPVNGPVDGAVAGPWIVAYSPSGEYAAVSNTNEDSVYVYKVCCKTGAFQRIQKLSTGFIAHSIAYSPDEQFAIVGNNDVGGSRATVTVHRINSKTGKWLAPLQTLEVPEVNYPYSVAYSPDGQFVAIVNYAAGAGSSFVSMYKANPVTGVLTLIDSYFPDFANDLGKDTAVFSPDGKFLAVSNFDSDTVSIYSVDADTGELSQISAPFAVGNGPEGVKYQHDGSFVAIANSADQSVTVYQVNQITGALSNAQTIDTTSANAQPGYIAYSKDDTVALVSSYRNPGSAVIFCVTDGIWCESPVQTLPPQALPEGVDFAPTSNFATVVAYGDGVNPGPVQVYEVHDSVCPSCL